MRFCLKGIIFLFATLFVIVYAIPLSFSADFAIKDVSLRNDGNELRVSFRLDESFFERIDDIVNSGAKVNIIFYVKIMRKRKLWMDENLLTIKIKHSIKYDVLKDEFFLKFSERRSGEIVVKDAAMAKKLICEVNNLKLMSTASLNESDRYYIMIKGGLDRLRLPFYLDHLLFILPGIWNAETPWKIVEFKK